MHGRFSGYSKKPFPGNLLFHFKFQDPPPGFTQLPYIRGLKMPLESSSEHPCTNKFQTSTKARNAEGLCHYCHNSNLPHSGYI